MKLFFIVPPAYQEQLDWFQDGYLLLPHIAEKDPKYAEFYKNNRKFKIMDNSAHELGESIEFGRVIEQAIRLNCDEIVLPDILFDKEGTIERSREALALLRGHYKNTLEDYGRLRIMAVPQGENFYEYLDCLDYFVSTPEITTIGLAFRVVERCFKDVTGKSGVLYNRSFLTSLIDERIKSGNTKYSKKEYHLLGIGDVKELTYQNQFEWIRSCDSSKQSKYAIAKEPFTVENGCADKIKGLLNFEVAYDEKILYKILDNIRVTKKIVKL